MMSRLKAIVKPLFYCLLASTTLRFLFLPAALCVLLVVPSTTHAEERAVGTYAVANCWSDRNGRSVSAFKDYYVNNGMRVRYACAANGEGLRGVITQNIPGKARVKAGMKAEVSIVAPAGTEMLEFTWDARIRRVDCACMRLRRPDAIAPPPLYSCSCRKPPCFFRDRSSHPPRLSFISPITPPKMPQR